MKKKIYMLLILFLGMIMIGCSAEENTSSNNQNQSNEGTSNGGSGGKLDVAYHLTLPPLDPHRTTDIGIRDVSLHIYETLITTDSNFELQPMLAESYEVSEDGKTITFNLRQGVLFHNGDELKASDVVASQERWQKMSTQAKTYLADVTWEAADDYTVIAHVPNPTIMTLAVMAQGHSSQFAAIMPEEVVKEVGEDSINEIIGTGPYKLEDFRVDQYVKLTRFEDYQSRTEPSNGMAGEKLANLDEITFHVVPDTSTRIAGLQSGEYDVATAIPHDNVEQLESNPDIKIEITRTPWDDVVINKKGIFKDQKLRHAINAALDKESLLLAAYGSDEYFSMRHELVTEDQTSWLTDVGSDVYNTYDPELAKQLLDEAGYNGEEIKILSTQERKYLYDMSVVAQEQLKSIGMNVKLINTDWATFIADLSDINAWDLYLGTLGHTPVVLEQLFWNPEWYGWTDSEEMQQLVQETLHAGSIEEASQYTDALHEIFWEYLPVIKIGDGSQLVATRSDMEGYIYHFNSPVYWNASIPE